MSEVEYVVTYFALASRRYVAVGIPNEEDAKAYARKMESYGSVARIFKMPSRNTFPCVKNG